jgi:MFS family permease
MKVNNSKVKSNIWKYYLATAIVQFAFFTPIIQLFYIDNNLTILKIATLGVIWTIVRMILEIPSSILADRWGRKKVLITSRLFDIFSIFTLIFATEYWHFILASIFFAVSYAFQSGTQVAFFYDTLKELKKEDQFDKYWARQDLFSQIPLLIAFIASGFLYKISPLLPFQLSIIFGAISLLILFTLTEPKYHKPVKEVNIFSHFKQSFNYILKNPLLKFMLIFTIIFCIGSDFTYGYGQVYLNYLALPVVLFGIVYTLKSLFVTIFANFTPSLRRKFSYKNLFGFEIFFLAILIFIMSFTNNYIVGALCFILIAIPHGLYSITSNSYIHKNLESHHRATIDSIFSFFIATTFLVIEPAAGYIADIYSIKLPLFIIGILIFIYGVYYLLKGHKIIASHTGD